LAVDEGAKRDGSTGVGEERLNVGRNGGFQNSLETEKVERLAGYEEAKETEHWEWVTSG